MSKQILFCPLKKFLMNPTSKPGNAFFSIGKHDISWAIDPTVKRGDVSWFILCISYKFAKLFFLRCASFVHM